MKTLETSKRTYTEEQIAFIEADIKRSYILKAVAGSGKTAVACERIKFLLANGVPPEKICFFSFTTAAVNELKLRLKNDAVKITTIHAFCLGMLAKMQKFKKIVDIFQFISWYKEKFKPKYGSSQEVKDEFYDFTSKMYDDAQYISAEITAFKLQQAEGIKCKLPKFFKEYLQYTIETKARDFADMLVEVNELLKENKWLRMFKNQYDYICCDEAQDQSVLMMRILLALNSKYYTLILDTNQSIYGYSGANAYAIMDMLRKRRTCEELTLSMNFRSSQLVVEHANNYSSLTAVPFSKEKGEVHKDILLLEDLLQLVKKKEEVAILVRTNAVIKEIEKSFLLRKIPIQYKNYLTEQECDDLKKAKENFVTKKKIKHLLPVYKTVDNIIEFIENCNQNCKSFIKSIHRSKGLEWDTVVLVNCISQEILTHNNIKDLTDEQFEQLSFDMNNPDHEEAKNVFYVGVTRPRKELFFCLVDI